MNSSSVVAALRTCAIGIAGAVLIWGCDDRSEVVFEAPGGTLSGTIDYTGAAAGPGRPLSIALYRSFPPKGPPVAAKLIENYSFPQRYQFSGLAPGTYYVGALIDVDRMDTRYAGMLAPKRDPHGYAGAGAPIAIDSTRGAALIDLELKDVAE